MAVERRRATGRRVHWRITPERVLVRLGLAEPTDRTASEVDAHRRLSRLGQAAKRVRALRASKAWEWRQHRARRRLDAAMGAAVEHAGLASDPMQQEALMAQLGALYHAAALADLTPAAPWDRRPAAVALDEPGYARCGASGRTCGCTRARTRRVGALRAARPPALP